MKWALNLKKGSILIWIFFGIWIEMQPNLFPFGTVLGNPYLFNGDLSEGLDSSRVFFLVPFLLFQGGGMDLSKVGEKILSSVRSARSLGLLPSTSDRPEVKCVAFFWWISNSRFQCYFFESNLLNSVWLPRKRGKVNESLLLFMLSMCVT